MSSGKEKTEASPAKAALEEIETFRSVFRAALKGYGTRIEDELHAVRIRIEALGQPDSISAGKLRDLREILTLLRHVDVRPEKGRRKDLKKLDSIVEDLSLLVEHW